MMCVTRARSTMAAQSFICRHPHPTPDPCFIYLLFVEHVLSSAIVGEFTVHPAVEKAGMVGTM